MNKEFTFEDMFRKNLVIEDLVEQITELKEENNKLKRKIKRISKKNKSTL